MSEFVDLVWIKEPSGGAVYEAPPWSVEDGDIATVYFTGMCGGNRDLHVKAHVTLAKESEAYAFIAAMNGGLIDKVKALYHKAEVIE